MLHNVYTDAPKLHPNLLWGSLQLLFWIFFHPTAWRNHIGRVDAALRSDFTLADLERQQWRNRELRRTLISLYLVLPAVVDLTVITTQWAVQKQADDLVATIAFSVGAGLVFSMTTGLAVSVVSGAAGGLVLTTTLSVLFAFFAVAPIDSDPGIKFSMSLAIAACITAGVTGSISGTITSQRPPTSLSKQLGGVIAGFAIGALAISAAASVAAGTAILSILGLIGNFLGYQAKDAGLGYSLINSVLCVAIIAKQRWYRGAGKILALFALLVIFVLAPALIVDLLGTTESVMGKLVRTFAYTLVLGLFLSALFSLPQMAAQRIAGPWTGAIAGGVGCGSAGLYFMMQFVEFMTNQTDISRLWLAFGFGVVALLAGLSWQWWRPFVLYPLVLVWNTVLLRAEERRDPGRSSLLPMNSAFWDEHQWLPLSGLDEHLVYTAERVPAEGRMALDYLAATPQRWAAQAALIELEARSLERCTTGTAIQYAHRSISAGELTGPAAALLRSFSRVSRDVNAALSQQSPYNQRLALSDVEDRLNNLERELTRSSEQYATRFLPIAARWREILSSHVRELTVLVESRQEIDNPYVIGVPLTEQQEIFVGRADISARIESFLLDRRRPPLLLYGQRRMGKTSLLNNLGRLLPSTIVPLFVDLQGPASLASDHAGFLYNIARDIVVSAARQRDLVLPPLPREALADDPFTCFDEWLDRVEKILGPRQALLALDEFEALDHALENGKLSEAAVLGMIRHLIQHRPRFKVLLAGAHTLDELQRWASYLINVQVLHISYLSEEETLQLVEHPIANFALLYEPSARQQVLNFTRGHPALVQLLCAEIVALKNEQPPAARRFATVADVNAAVPLALASGSLFFADIERNQVDAGGRAVLHFLAAQQAGAAVSRDSLRRHLPSEVDSDRAVTLLLRRELIESIEGSYRFQVELVRRWFARERTVQ